MVPILFKRTFKSSYGGFIKQFCLKKRLSGPKKLDLAGFLKVTGIPNISILLLWLGEEEIISML